MNKLVIRFLGDIEFECLISDDLVIEEVLCDTNDYILMIDEIIRLGRINVIDFLRTTRIPESLDELVELLQEDFDCTIEEQ